MNLLNRCVRAESLFARLCVPGHKVDVFETADTRRCRRMLILFIM